MQGFSGIFRYILGVKVTDLVTLKDVLVVANNPVSVQYLKIYSLFAHVETFAVNNDINYIRNNCGKRDIYGIKVGCNLFTILKIGSNVFAPCR